MKTVIIPPPVNADEHGVFALLALLNDPKGFAKRIAELTDLRTAAEGKLAELAAKETELAAREESAAKLKAEGAELVAVYTRTVEEWNEKVAQLNRERQDFDATVKAWRKEVKETTRALADEAAKLKLITDGLEQREKDARESLAQGEHLQNEYGAKLDQLKTIAAA